MCLFLIVVLPLSLYLNYCFVTFLSSIYLDFHFYFVSLYINLRLLPIILNKRIVKNQFCIIVICFCNIFILYLFNQRSCFYNPPCLQLSNSVSNPVTPLSDNFQVKISFNNFQGKLFFTEKKIIIINHHHQSSSSITAKKHMTVLV